MPGNEVRDRVHNFFAPDNLFQGQHHSQVLDGNWPVGNNLLVGSQRSIGGLSSNQKNYNLQQSDTEIGSGTPLLQVPHGMNFSQSTLRPDFALSQSQSLQPNLNGYIHGRQVLQTRQNEANFLGVDTESDQHNTMLRGSPLYESQQSNGPEHHKNISVRSETSDSPVSFDFFGGQQQMSGQQSGMLQPLSRQQSGFNDMQLLQQEVIFRKMQEFQRQQQFEARQQQQHQHLEARQHQQLEARQHQQLEARQQQQHQQLEARQHHQHQQLEARQHHQHQQLEARQQQQHQQHQQLEARQQSSINHVPDISKQGSVNHFSALNNNTSINEAPNYPWATELTASNSNWLQHGNPAVEGSSNGILFPSNQGQAMRFTGMVPQQVDQSRYGVPVSNSRGSQNQYSHIAIDKPSMQQVPTSSSSFPGNQYAGFSDQVSIQDGPSVSGQGIQGKNMFSHASVQDCNSGMSLENLRQINALQGNTSMQEFLGRQELAGSSETLQEKPMMQNAHSQTAVALDPTEEKFLFGTDDNIWNAFGGSINIGSGGCNPLDGNGLLNGFPSVQSGSWSALMQSAVAETSSSDVGPQEEWGGLSYQNTEIPSGNHQPSPYNDSRKQQAVSADNYLQSTLNSGSVPFSDHVTLNNNQGSIPGFQQSGHKGPYEHGEKMHIGSTQRSTQHSAEEGSKWLNQGPLQKPSAVEGPSFQNTSYSLDAALTAQSSLSPWTRQQNMSSYKNGDQPCNRSLGWGESASPSGDAATKFHEKDNSWNHMHSNDHKGATYEEAGRVGGVLDDSVNNSAVEFEHVKSAMGSAQINRQDSGSGNTGVMPNSSTVRVRQEVKQPPQDRHNPYWKSVDSSSKCTDVEASGKSQPRANRGSRVMESESVKMHEMENRDKRENSSDSHQSHLLHTSTGGLKENVSSDAGNSRGLPWGKQKLAGPAGRRTSGPRKFQYHPMGNLDDNEEPSYGTKHAIHSQGISQKLSQGANSQSQGHFGQPSNFANGPNNSLEVEKGHLHDLQGSAKRLDEAPPQRPGYIPSTSASLDRSVGMSVPNKDPQLSQNMLELLHKVDQSREHSGVHFSSPECPPSSEMHEADSSDGSVGHFQQNQSFASQGFGLQLAPPSQRLPVPNRALSSHSSANMVNSVSPSLTNPGIREKVHVQLASAPQFQSLPPLRGTSKGELRSGKFDIPQQTDNEGSPFNVQGTMSSALNSGFPHSKSRLQSQHPTSKSGQVTTNQSVGISAHSHASFSKQAEDSYSQAPVSQSAPPSLPDTTGSTRRNNTASSSDAAQPVMPDQSHVGVFTPKVSTGEVLPVSHPFTTSGFPQQAASSKMSPYARATNPAQESVLSAQNQKVPLNFFQSHHLHNDIGSTLSSAQNVKDKGPGGSSTSEFDAGSLKSRGMIHEEKAVKDSPGQQGSSGNVDLAGKMNASQGNESIVKHFPDSSHSNPPSTQKDFEAFGRSLKPIGPLNQNYSLLHQIGAMKSSDIDPSDRELKRFKGADSGEEGHQVAPMSRESNDQSTRGEDALVHRAAASGDSKMLNFTGPISSWERNSPSQFVNAASKDPLDSGANNYWNSSQSANVASVMAEHSQVSPQMAPSWFNQFGSFKNGHMLPMYSAEKAVPVKSLEQPFAVGKSSDSWHKQNKLTEQVNAAADTSHIVDARQSPTSTPVAREHLSSTPLLPTDVRDQQLDVLRTKKRKSATPEVLPWHKEVLQGSEHLLSISKSEVNWSKAANRLVDKVDDEADIVEDGPPLLRSRRRLILTAQLMQQLFCPPPAAVLSSDARLNYENLAYMVARLAVGDACSVISCTSSNLHGSLDSTNLVPIKHGTSDKIGDKDLSRVVENFLDRARKLQNDFLSKVEKRTSVLDLRVETQELEKFSVINRFAKFHGRGQAEGAAETSSSADAAAAAAVNSQKLCPQRYVTALPMPRNLPDRVQCHSL